MFSYETVTLHLNLILLYDFLSVFYTHKHLFCSDRNCFTDYSVWITPTIASLLTLLLPSIPKHSTYILFCLLFSLYCFVLEVLSSFWKHIHMVFLNLYLKSSLPFQKISHKIISFICICNTKIFISIWICFSFFLLFY